MKIRALDHNDINKERKHNFDQWSLKTGWMLNNDLVRVMKAATTRGAFLRDTEHFIYQ